MIIHITHDGKTFSFVANTPANIDLAPIKPELIAVSVEGQNPFWDARRSYKYKVPEEVKAAVIEKITENIVI